MPRKFNISVTGCREECAQDSINDVALEPARKRRDNTEIKGFNIRVGGGLGGREPRRARSLDIFVEPTHATEIVRAFIELYHDEGNRQNRNKNRARFFVDDWGTDVIREELEGHVDFPVEPAGTNLRTDYTYNAGKPPTAGKHDHIGVHEQQDGRYYVGLNVAVGRLSAEDAITLADLADQIDRLTLQHCIEDDAGISCPNCSVRQYRFDLLIHRYSVGVFPDCKEVKLTSDLIDTDDVRFFSELIHEPLGRIAVQVELEDRGQFVAEL